MVVAVRFDARQEVRLLPRLAGNLKSVVGAGYAAMFLITCASMGYSVYGPAILQTLAGLSALTAGYVIALEAIAWTTAGLMVAHLTGAWPSRMIRLGVAIAALGVGISALVFPSGSVLGAGLAGIVLGGGFGLSSAFMNQRLLEALPEDERGIGAAAMSTVRQTGNAAGAAMAAAIANLSGVAHGFTTLGTQSAGRWIFIAALPVAFAGVVAAWRLGREKPAT
jgi:MFS family permease